MQSVHNWQHFAIYPGFFISGAVDLLLYFLDIPLPDGGEKVSIGIVVHPSCGEWTLCILTILYEFQAMGCRPYKCSLVHAVVRLNTAPETKRQSNRDCPSSSTYMIPSILAATSLQHFCSHAATLNPVKLCKKPVQSVQYIQMVCLHVQYCSVWCP